MTLITTYCLPFAFSQKWPRESYADTGAAFPDQFNEPVCDMLQLTTSPTCAGSGVWRRQIKALDEKSARHHYMSCRNWGSGAEGEERRGVFWQAHAFGQDDAEAVDERGLSGVGLKRRNASGSGRSLRSAGRRRATGCGRTLREWRAASFRGRRAVATSRGSFKSAKARKQTRM